MATSPDPAQSELEREIAHALEQIKRLPKQQRDALRNITIGRLHIPRECEILGIPYASGDRNDYNRVLSSTYYSFYGEKRSRKKKK